MAGMNSQTELALLDNPIGKVQKILVDWESRNFFWGITGGCMDSMVANYTALKKKDKSDDLTAGGKITAGPTVL